MSLPTFAARSETRFQEVTVKPGDTLWSIAHVYLKDPSRWDEILKYNHLPSSDPTIALPGMILRVPALLIKERFRAANLIFILHRVLLRRADTARWDGTSMGMQVYRGDSLRTLENSRAKVKFINAELLSLEPNTLAIIKPPETDTDVELKAGEVFAGRARVVTASARIVPKTGDTRYAASVRGDLSTFVQVYSGLAAVEAQGRAVEVKAGMASEVRMGLAPGLPFNIPNLPEFEARVITATGIKPRQAAPPSGGATRPSGGAAPVAPAPDADAAALDRAGNDEDLLGDIGSSGVGVPILGYHIQASSTRVFRDFILDKKIDVDERLNFSAMGVRPGIYWFRMAVIDLLGTEGNFSVPRLYSIGVAGRSRRTNLESALVIVKPARDENVDSEYYNVIGFCKYPNLAVTVNGKPARMDEKGNFSIKVTLKAGRNTIAITVEDGQGNTSTVTRHVTYGGE